MIVNRNIADRVSPLIEARSSLSLPRGDILINFKFLKRKDRLLIMMNATTIASRIKYVTFLYFMIFITVR